MNEPTIMIVLQALQTQLIELEDKITLLQESVELLDAHVQDIALPVGDGFEVD